MYKTFNTISGNAQSQTARSRYCSQRREKNESNARIGHCWRGASTGHVTCPFSEEFSSSGLLLLAPGARQARVSRHKNRVFLRNPKPQWWSSGGANASACCRDFFKLDAMPSEGRKRGKVAWGAGRGGKNRCFATSVETHPFVDTPPSA